MGNFVKAFMVKPVGPGGPIPVAVKKDTTAAYGKYLAMSVAECNGCHTERNLAGEFTGEPPPADLDRVDPGRTGPPVGPADELLDLIFVSLGEELDGAVRPVLHPPREAEPLRLPLGRGAEEDPLDAPANEEVDPFERHRATSAPARR